jgi:hypothetical protein
MGGRSSGKTTILRALQEMLEDRLIDVKYFNEKGELPEAEGIILVDDAHDKPRPALEAVLVYAEKNDCKCVFAFTPSYLTPLSSPEKWLRLNIKPVEYREHRIRPSLALREGVMPVSLVVGSGNAVLPEFITQVLGLPAETAIKHCAYDYANIMSVLIEQVGGRA